MTTTTVPLEQSLTKIIPCTHCDETVVIPMYNADDEKRANPFCCLGCMTVYNVIHQKGLNDYYEIKNNSKVFKRRAPVDLKAGRFSYLDSEDFLKEYTYKSSDKLPTMEFYLEGVHCLACLWLIEKLPDFLTDVKFSRLDMGRSVATVTIFPDGKFSNVARELNNLGYRPHPLKRNEDIVKYREKEERSTMLKIGIAGAGAGNIMLYAVSIYAGADGMFLKIFSIMNVVFAVPVLTYSALPFYQNAWNAIKTKTLSIDVPIAMALIIGLFMGVYNLLVAGGDNYFDSLTALVFLLSLSRYFLNKIQEQGLKANDLNFFYQSTSVLKKEGDTFIEIHPKYLKKDDVIKLKALEIIPADGIILDGNSSVNNSLLTGESIPVKVSVNDTVFSGTQNLSHDLIIKVTKTDVESRLGSILKRVEDGWIQKSKIVDITNRISKHFIITVFILAGVLGLWLYLHGHPKEAIERSLTLLIVTCPCALALATPLTLTNTLSKASKKGIIIKNDLVIEKLTNVKNVFLDKTGTITYGNLRVDQWNIVKTPQLPLQNIIATLEQKSVHPVARSLKDYIGSIGPIEILAIENLEERLGVGVSGNISGIHYKIFNNSLYENDELILTFTLRDQVRNDSRLAIKLLKNLHINPMMVSGDQKSIVASVAREVGIDENSIYGGVSPEEKLNIIEKAENAMMIGDGANDAMALSRSFVGVAVCGSMDISLRAADVYLTTPGIKPITDLIIISNETMKVIYRNLILSLMYNGISVWAAYTGVISPLTAAIIMPISSLTVLISTLIGTKLLNERLKV